jgi:hypothetical protein
MKKDLMYGTRSMHSGKYMYTKSLPGKLQGKQLLLSEHTSGGKILSLKGRMRSYVCFDEPKGGHIMAVCKQTFLRIYKTTKTDNSKLCGSFINICQFNDR